MPFSTLNRLFIAARPHSRPLPIGAHSQEIINAVKTPSTPVITAELETLVKGESEEQLAMFARTVKGRIEKTRLGEVPALT